MKKGIIKCNVATCIHNDCNNACCSLDEIKISCTCDNDCCKETGETVCESFETEEE